MALGCGERGRGGSLVLPVLERCVEEACCWNSTGSKREKCVAIYESTRTHRADLLLTLHASKDPRRIVANESLDIERMISRLDIG